MSAEKPPEGQITPEDVASQFMVLRTKDNRVAVQFPTKSPTDQTIDAPETLALMAAGLNTVAEIIRQQTPVEKPRIVLASAIPKEFLTRNRPD